MAQTLKLYGMEISYYTGKIRAYLRWKDIPFEEVVADRNVYKTVILPRVGWPVVPVIVTDRDETLQDTSDMIDYFENRYPTPAVVPTTPKQKLASLLLEVYGDEWLGIPAMHYRWNFNKDWVMEQFGAASQPDASVEEQRKIGAKTSKPFAGALPFLGVTDEMVPAVEKSYEGLLEELNAHFSEHDYLLGSRPSIGDYGMIGPFYAHLYRDPESGKIMKRLAPKVAAWVERTEFAPVPKSGNFLHDDAIPETLLPVLRRMMREQMPVLVNTVGAYEKWASSNSETEVPRALGMHTFTVEGQSAERAIFPFNQWMLQRPYDYYRSLNDAEKSAADNLLSAVGGEAFGNLRISARVKRENFKLVRND